MANEYTTINDFCINLFDANKLVNTITTVETDSMDTNKQNIYPLVNLDMQELDVLDDQIVYTYEITIVKQRDIKPQKIDSKLLSNTNYSDNINETSSIAQRFINILTRQNNDENIEVEDKSILTPLSNWRGAGLDGVQFTIDLSIPNDDTSC